MDASVFGSIRDSVRTFVREQVMPREQEIEDADAVPADIRRRAVDMGLFGYTIPEEFGGLGLNTYEDALLTFEFGYTTPAFRSMFSTNNGIAGQVLVNFGTPEQQREWLPRLVSGTVACFALTEAEAGSDPSGLTTRAKRDGDEFVISGAKRFITNAPLADVFMTFARSTGADGADGISVFAVPAGTPGLTVGPPDRKMGQIGSQTSEVFLDNVRVPLTALIGGEEGRGFGAAMRSLVKGRLNVAAVCVGAAQRLLDESVAHARSNRQGGTPIGEFQLIQAMLAETKVELDAGRALVLATAQRFDSGEDRRVGPSAAKLFCSEMVGRAADRAVQIHGGLGYMRGVPVERFYRDVRLFRIYEGTSEIQKLIIGRALIKG